MNKDHLLLIALGLVGLIIRLIINGKTADEPLWLKIHVLVVYIMILLGVLGIFLLIINLF